jgi:hypothetical protein
VFLTSTTFSSFCTPLYSCSLHLSSIY